jgi:hypothetical protein
VPRLAKAIEPAERGGGLSSGPKLEISLLGWLVASPRLQRMEMKNKAV